MVSSFANPNTTVQATLNGQIPQVSRSYTFSITLATGTSLTFDLRSQQNLNVFKDAQGIFVDNSANSTAVSITFPNLQTLIVPPYSQAVLPIYLPVGTPVLTFAGNGTVNFVLINFPTPAAVWTVSDNVLPIIGGEVQVYDATVAGLLNTGIVALPATTNPIDAAATEIVTGGTAVTVFPANSVIHGGVIKNPTGATEALFVDITNTAGTTEPGTNGTTFSLAAGQSFTVAPSSVAVTANAVTSGHTFVATSW